MNRGSAPSVAIMSSHRLGFNEAPIHESGKCPGRRLRPPARSGFNEAPIHESGKFDSLADFADRDDSLQ